MILLQGIIYLPVEETLDELVAYMEAMRRAFLASGSDTPPCRCASITTRTDTPAEITGAAATAAIEALLQED